MQSKIKHFPLIKAKIKQYYIASFSLDFIQSWKHKFIFQVGGRLANKMFGYAFLLALRSKYGFRVFLEGRHLEHLSYFFENIDQVESLNNLCDEGNSFPWTNSTEVWTDLGKPDLKIGQCIDYYKNVSKYVILGKRIYPGDCTLMRNIHFCSTGGWTIPC